MTVHRVILADDHPLLLRELAGLVAAERDFQVVGMANSGRQALAVLERVKPDLAILDISMPDLDGLAVLRTVHRARLKTRVIFLSASISPARISEALAQGASGLLLKKTAPDMLVDCMRTVAGGRRWHPEESRVRADPAPPRLVAAPPPRLTPREREIVDLVRRGLSNKAIAAALGTAEGTVKIHLHTIFRKLKITSRTALTALNLDIGERA